MTIDEYIELLSSPETVTPEAREDLEAMLAYAPYCASARLLLLKVLYQTHDTNYAKVLPLTVLYAHERKDAYFLLHPKEIIRHTHIGADDYFTLIRQLERRAAQTGESFAALAEKLKQARSGGITTPNTPKKSVNPKPYHAQPEPSLTEEDAKKCIEKHDYQGAIAILQDLNLRNPKKSRYFAVQIEFLQKAVQLQENKQAN